jgi:hypothetical protein
MSSAFSIRTAALAAVLCAAGAGAPAAGELTHPDWKGQWIRSVSANFDPSKPAGRGQQAPLTDEYRAIMEASLAAQAAGGQGNDPMARCIPPGMPRMMIGYGLGMEILITADTTHILFGEPMRQLRRIYTDGRAWPQAIEPSFSGYSIGRWEDDDGHGHYATLAVETRAIKSPRSLDSSGIPVHADGQTIVKERIYLDPAKPGILYDEETVLDHALTRPWTVKRTYRQVRDPVWLETICDEADPQIRIGAEDYFLTSDRILMPTRKDQPPPDLRNFK